MLTWALMLSQVSIGPWMQTPVHFPRRVINFRLAEGLLPLIARQDLEHFPDSWAPSCPYQALWLQHKMHLLILTPSRQNVLLSTSKQISSFSIASSLSIHSMPLLQSHLSFGAWYQPLNQPPYFLFSLLPIDPLQPIQFFQIADIQWLSVVSKKKSPKNLRLTFGIFQIWLVYL